MIAIDLLLTNDEQNEGNEQTVTCGCADQPSVGICSSNSFCSSFVGKKAMPDLAPETTLRQVALPQVPHVAALLDEWRHGLNQMRGHPPPLGFNEGNWRQLKLDANALLQTHGERLAALGWTTLELFGLHLTHPAVRVSHSGLARFLHRTTIVDLTDRFARVRTRDGSLLTFYRTEPQPGAVPAWELHHREGDDRMDYSMEFDAGAQDAGPWLTWHAAPTRDGIHAAGTWSVKDNTGRTTVNLSSGFVLDWPTSKTGWIQAGGVPGVAPRKQWNASRSRFERQPGDDWKRAMRAPIAYVLDRAPTFAVWEQNSFGAWTGFCDLMALLKIPAPGELPKLPLVSFTGHRSVKLGNGVTLVPMFKVLRYVLRPLCLPDDTATQAPADSWDASPSSARTASTAGLWTAGGNGSAETVQTSDGAPPPGGDSKPLIDDEIPW